MSKILDFYKKVIEPCISENSEQLVKFEKHVLKNGLRVILHQDKSTPLAVVNLLYDVGARDESPDKTGFAHLFEHLMFGGTEQVPNFDVPIQNAGGDSNAFTNNDITNYYSCLLYTSPSPRDATLSRMPSSA